MLEILILLYYYVAEMQHTLVQFNLQAHMYTDTRFEWADGCGCGRSVHRESIAKHMSICVVGEWPSDETRPTGIVCRPDTHLNRIRTQ